VVFMLNARMDVASQKSPRLPVPGRAKPYQESGLVRARRKPSYRTKPRG
jgi:hypothetical protein